MLQAAAVAAGVALGLAARAVDDFAPRWVGNVAAVWFLVAFLVGRLHRDSRRAAAAGVLTLGSGCVAYYTWRVVVDRTISTRYLATVAVLWLLAAVVTGATGGALGGSSWTAAYPWGVGAGVFTGEAISVFLLSQRVVQVVLELAVAAAFLVRRPVRQTIRPAGAAAAVVSAAVFVYRIVLR